MHFRETKSCLASPARIFPMRFPTQSARTAHRRTRCVRWRGIHYAVTCPSQSILPAARRASAPTCVIWTARRLGFSKKLDAVMSSLKEQGCDRLIIDLRSCLGGSLGFARLVSYMCPDQRPIGYDITRARQLQGYDVTHLPRVRMPDTRAGVLARLAQFSVRDKSLVLLTQGLGKQPFHGQIVILINEKTSSAGEMAAQFAKDSKLAILVGQTTAGLVLGATVINMGKGYSLFLPVFGWFSAGGTHNEGSGVVPDVVIDIDPVRLSRGEDDQVNKALELLAA